MTAQPDNVRPLPPSPAAEALAEARAIPAGHLDRILADEAAKPADPAQEAWRELIASGDAIRIADRAWPGGIVAGFINERDEARRERDQARACAVHLEQIVGEIDHQAQKWAGMSDSLVRGMGRVLLDITRGEPDHAA